MVTAMNQLHQEFMDDETAKSYVQWLEARIDQMQAQIDALQRNCAAMEQAAGINHQMWAQANDEANRMAAALVVARTALRAGNDKMLRKVLEA